MQITLIRHGKYDEGTGHISRDGIEESIGVGFLLGRAVLGEKINFLEDCVIQEGCDKYPMVPIETFPAEYQVSIQKPDLILTSSLLQAKETGFVVFEQLKHLGLEAEVRNNIAYLNDLELFSKAYKVDQNQQMSARAFAKLCATEQIQKTIDFIQRLAKEGKKHIVIVSHQSNIHTLLNLLGKEGVMTNKAPQNGVAYTFPSVDSEKIGQEKYLYLRRYGHASSIKRSTLRPVPDLFETVEAMEWKIPDFIRIESAKKIKKARRAAHIRD